MIGAKPFAEQYILAALMQQRLEARGLSASRREGLGSSVAFASLKAGEIDAYVEYTGTLWANEMKRTDIKPPDAMLAETKEWLAREHKITMLGSLGFENAYALAMPRKRAEALGIRTMADLARNAGSLSIASDYEFFGRPDVTQRGGGCRRKRRPRAFLTKLASAEKRPFASRRSSRDYPVGAGYLVSPR